MKEKKFEYYMRRFCPMCLEVNKALLYSKLKGIDIEYVESGLEDPRWEKIRDIVGRPANLPILVDKEGRMIFLCWHWYHLALLLKKWK